MQQQGCAAAACARQGNKEEEVEVHNNNNDNNNHPQKIKIKIQNPMEKIFKILHRKHKLLTQGEKEKIKVFVYNLTGTCF
jgi:hypothetical protein